MNKSCSQILVQLFGGLLLLRINTLWNLRKYRVYKDIFEILYQFYRLQNHLLWLLNGNYNIISFSKVCGSMNILHFGGIGLGLGTLAMVLIYRKRKFGLFDLLMTNLLLSNTIYLTIIIIMHFYEKRKSNSGGQIYITFQSVCLRFTRNSQTYLLVMISLQRVLIVVFPLKSKRWITKRKTDVSLIVLYILSIVFETLSTQKAIGRLQ